MTDDRRLSRRKFGVGLLSVGVAGAFGMPELALARGDIPVPAVNVKVVGVGGAGGNVVDAMIRERVTGVDYIAVDTDEMAVGERLASRQLRVAPVLLAPQSGRGMMDAREARPEEHPDRRQLAQALTGADMVIIVAGLSTGSGSGVAVLVADVARALGAVVVAVVTHEGGNRQGRQTAHAVNGLATRGVPIVAVPMKRLWVLLAGGQPIFLADKARDRRVRAFADGELGRTVRALADLACRTSAPGPRLLDQMRNLFPLGPALAFAGTATARAQEVGGCVVEAAAERAVCTPVVNLRAAVTKARWVTVTVACAARFEHAMGSAVPIVQRLARPDARHMFGWVRDDALGDEVRVTVIAGSVSSKLLIKAPPSALERPDAGHEDPYGRWDPWTSSELK